MNMKQKCQANFASKALNRTVLFGIILEILLLYRSRIIQECVMLRTFETFLSKKETVKTQYLPFYLKWVSDCYAFLNEPLDNRLASEERKQFLTHIAKRHEEWQVKQADTALRLYDYFLSKAAPPKTDEPVSHNERWQHVEEKMRDALRLRHRALSTEKTYLIWLRNFRGFVGEKHPHQLEGRDL
jgi:hypothetical protein